MQKEYCWELREGTQCSAECEFVVSLYAVGSIGYHVEELYRVVLMQLSVCIPRNDRPSGSGSAEGSSSLRRNRWREEKEEAPSPRFALRAPKGRDERSTGKSGFHLRNSYDWALDKRRQQLGTLTFV